MNYEEMRNPPQNTENNSQQKQKLPQLSENKNELPSLAYDQAKERRFCTRLGLGFALYSIISSVFANLIYLLVSGASEDLAKSVIFQNLLSPIALYLFALPILLLVAAGLEPSVPKKEKLSFGGWFLFLLVGFGLMYIGNYIGIAVTGLLSSIFNPSYTNPIQGLVGTDSLLINFICLVVIAPIGEELVFRKLLMDRLNRYGGAVSVVLSALMFGLMHGNFSQFFYAALLGLVMGYLYYRTGNVWLTVALHAAINFVGGIVSTLISNGLIQMNEDMGKLDQSMEGMIGFLTSYGWLLLFLLLFFGFVIASIICAIVLPIVYRKDITFQKGRTILPAGKRWSTVLLNVGMITMLAVYAAELILSIF